MQETPAFRRETACCFSGHRPGRLPGGYAGWHAAGSPLRYWIRCALDEAYADGYRDFVCGMALGADTLAAEEVLALRERHPSVRLIAAIPCPGQETRWTPPDRSRYRSLLARADWQITLCPAYAPYAMHVRNRWMVEHCTHLVAYVTHPASNAGKVVEWGRIQGKRVVELGESLAEEGLPIVWFRK